MSALPSMHVEFDASDVLAAIERFGAEWTGQALEDGLAAGAMLVVNDAKRIVHKVTGTLSRSLHVGGHTELARDFAGSQGYSDVGGNRHDALTAEIYAGTNLVYAAREEFGFFGADKLGRVYSFSGHPYLRPAFDLNAERVPEAAAKVFDQARARAGL